jgi:hypothetical protein
LSEKSKLRLLVISKKITEGIIFLSIAIIIGAIIIILYLLNTDKFFKIPGMVGWEDPLPRIKDYCFSFLLPALIVPNIISIILFNVINFFIQRKLNIIGYGKRVKEALNALKVREIQEDRYYFKTSP